MWELEFEEGESELVEIESVEIDPSGPELEISDSLISFSKFSSSESPAS